MIRPDSFDVLGTVTQWVKILQSRYVERLGLTNKRGAWEIIASEAGLSVGSVEGIARDRVKEVSTNVYLAIQDLFIRELTSEARAIETHIANARRLDFRPAAGSISQAAAALADARAALGQHH